MAFVDMIPDVLFLSNCIGQKVYPTSWFIDRMVKLHQSHPYCPLQLINIRVHCRIFFTSHISPSKSGFSVKTSSPVTSKSGFSVETSSPVTSAHQNQVSVYNLLHHSPSTSRAQGRIGLYFNSVFCLYYFYSMSYFIEE